MARLNALALVAILFTGCASTDRADAAQARLNHSGVEELHTGPYTGPLPTDTTEGRDIIIP